MESLVFNNTLAVLTLLIVASFVAIIGKRSPLPYSILLVISGLGISYLTELFPGLEFLANFSLSPDMVFFIFLPTLIFESAYNINFLHFRRSFRTIALLATVTFAISTMIIGLGTHYIFGIAPLIALLFGSIISSTDPVAVLAIFKKIGAPPRLSTIIEGESLLNDGMALVTFGILLGLIQTSTGFNGLATVSNFSTQLIYVLVGGTLVGGLLGILFSTLIALVKKNRHIEITLTIILAHTTFLIAESLLGVSGILATMVAGMIIGNYGRHKISPDVKEFMTDFWEFSAFISNSLIFLLVGKEIFDVLRRLPSFSFTTILTITLLAMVARAISVYLTLPLINLGNTTNRISSKWAHILQWGGIRGALALALLLSLPETFPQRDLILLLGLTVVLMSLLINGNTVKWLINKLNLNAFSLIDTFEKHECKIVIDQQILNRLETLRQKNFISDETFAVVEKYYREDEAQESKFITRLIKTQNSEGCHECLSLILQNHFLGIERQVFQKLYHNGEITEKLLQILLNNVDEQIETIDSDEKVSLAPFFYISSKNRILKSLRSLKWVDKFLKNRRHDEITLRYEMYRARIIAINKVLRIINNLFANKQFAKLQVAKKLKQKYKQWAKKAEAKAAKMRKRYPRITANTELYLTQKFCLHKEESQIRELLKAEILSSKVAQSLLADIRKRKQDNYKLICRHSYASDKS